MTLARHARPLIAGIASLAGAAWLVRDVGRSNEVVLIPVAFVALAAALAHVGRLGAQLFARASWWANLGLGTILCVLGSRSELRQGVPLAIANATALLVMGRAGLTAAEERAGYTAAAHRGSLLFLMVIALADCQTMLLMGAAETGGHVTITESSLFFLGTATLLVVGFVGLFRLATWGILVNVGASILGIAVVAGRLVRMDSDFMPVVVVLALVQLAAAVPLLVAVSRGRPLLPPLSPKAQRSLAIAMILLPVVVCLCAAIVR